MGEQAKLKCIYCQVNEATTDDHVPPKGLFQKGSDRSVLFTVPACQPCNVGFSKDEEWFRIFASTAAFERSEDATSIYFDKIKRSMTRERQLQTGQPLLRRHLERLQLVDITTPTGLFTGKKMTKFTITKEDWRRHHNVLDKITRGVYYNKTGNIIPKSMRIKHVMLSGDQVRKQMPLLKSLKYELNPSFSCGFNIVPSTDNALMLTVFYGYVTFLTFIVDPGLAKVWDDKFGIPEDK